MYDIISAIMIILFVVCVARNIKEWVDNNNSPKLTVNATVVFKEKKIRHRHGDHGPRTAHNYYITFCVDSGDEVRFRVTRSEYEEYEEGCTGALTFQGTRYLGFIRSY